MSIYRIKKALEWFEQNSDYEFELWTKYFYVFLGLVDQMGNN